MQIYRLKGVSFIMKKILSYLLVCLLILSSVSFNIYANSTPSSEEINDIFTDMGYSSLMSGEKYIWRFADAPEGQIADDSLVFEYMMNCGALDDYIQYYDYYSEYTVPYEDYMNLVDKFFVNHSDMKNYFRKTEYIDFDEENNIISWQHGGSGDAFTWIPLYTSYCDDEIFVNGVFAYYGYETDGLTENKDYITINGHDASIREELLLVLKHIDNEWKIIEFHPCDYHIVDGVLYHSNYNKIYYNIQFNEGNSSVEEYEDSKNFTTSFYGNDLDWYLPGDELHYKVTVDERYVISNIILNDDKGSHIIDISDSGVCKISPNGSSVVNINTREEGDNIFEEFVYRMSDFFTLLSLRISSIFDF